MAKRTRTSKYRQLFETRIRPKPPFMPLVLLSGLLVVLVLLTTPLAERSVRVDLPAASNTAPLPVMATHTLTVNLNGALSLDGKAYASVDLPSALGRLAAESPEPTLEIRGARGLTYRPIKQVFDLAAGAGIHDIRLEVEAVASTPRDRQFNHTR